MIGAVRVRGDECWAHIAFCDACYLPHRSPIYVLEHPVRITANGNPWATFYVQCPNVPRTLLLTALPNGNFSCSVRPRMEDVLVRKPDDDHQPSHEHGSRT